MEREEEEEPSSLSAQSLIPSSDASELSCCSEMPSSHRILEKGICANNLSPFFFNICVPVLYILCFRIGEDVFCISFKEQGPREGGGEHCFPPPLLSSKGGHTDNLHDLPRENADFFFFPLHGVPPLPLPPSVTVSCSVRREWKEEKGENLLPPTYVPPM